MHRGKLLGPSLGTEEKGLIDSLPGEEKIQILKVEQCTQTPLKKTNKRKKVKKGGNSGQSEKAADVTEELEEGGLPIVGPSPSPAVIWDSGLPSWTLEETYVGMTQVHKGRVPRWYVEFGMEGVEHRWLLDTGCPATLISWREFGRLDHKVRQRLQGTNRVYSGVTGSELPVRGLLTTTLTFPVGHVGVNLIVADIAIPGIVGMDVLSAIGARVDLTEGRLQAGDVDMVLLDRPSGSGVRVAVCQDTTVPPYSERVLELELEWKPGEKLCWEGQFCPDTQTLFELDVLATEGMVSARNKKIVIPIRNNSGVTKRIIQGTGLGYVEEIQECEQINFIHDKKFSRGKESNLLQIQRNDNRVKDRTETDYVLEPKKPNEDNIKPKSSDDEKRGRYGLPQHLQCLMTRIEDRLPREKCRKIAKIIRQYEDIFVGQDGQLGTTSEIRHRIDVGDTAPIKQPLRRVPYRQHEIIEDEVTKMKKAGVVEDSNSPWSSPVVLVRKKDGSTRFCIDYRKLNQVTKMDAYPLPRIDESFDTLAGSQYFTTLDLASGYWQVEMDPQDKAKTAFATRTGLYEFNVMPFGLSTAPATFERLMEMVMRGIQWKKCLVYLDDVVCIGRTFEDALENIQAVFERLRKAGLKVKPSKCEMLREEVKFLGHIVTRDGIMCDPGKIEAVKNYTIPKNVTDVRSFLGFVGYYRKFIRDFSSIATPLNELLCKDQKFYWGRRQQEAFDQLRGPLMKEPLLIYPDLTQDFILDTDASGFGVGGVLSQFRDGREKVVAYASFGLRPTQRNYCTTKRELLAVVSMIHHFRHYLWGRKFKLRTDHASLRWLINFKDAEGMIARWMARIASYDYELEFREGKKHGNADGLSRCRQCKRDGCPADGKNPRKVEYDSDEDLLPELSGEIWGEDIAFVTEDWDRVDWTEDKFCGDGLDRIHLISDEIQKEREILAYSLRSKGKSKPKDKDPEKEPSPVSREDNWMPQYTNEEIIQRQEQDPDIATIKKWKETSENRPEWRTIREKSQTLKSLWQQWDALQIEVGILKRAKNVNGKSSPIKQWIVPSALRKEIFEELHSGRMSGHLGINRTRERIRERMYWPGIKADVTRWSSQCLKCEARKPRAGPKRHPLGTIPSGAPFERIAIDIMEPGTITDNGNRYIMVVNDYFTKWSEAYAIKDHTAYTVADVLATQYICRYGVPRTIHTDQGKEFESHLFQKMCTLLKCDKTRTTPYHPQSDGLVERQNRTILAMLSAVVNEMQNDWDDHLPYIMSAYRSSVQESTGCSPNLMLFGRENLLPLDLIYPLSEEQYPECSHEYVEWLRQALNTAHEHARNKLKTSNCRQRRNYDLKSLKREYKIGTWVWYWYPPSGRKKLGLGWTGPYLVIDDKMERAVKIQLTPEKDPKIVHIDNLKVFRGEAPQKSWIITVTEIDPNEEEKDSRKGGENQNEEISLISELNPDLSKPKYRYMELNHEEEIYFSAQSDEEYYSAEEVLEIEGERSEGEESLKEKKKKNDSGSSGYSAGSGDSGSSGDSARSGYSAGSGDSARSAGSDQGRYPVQVENSATEESHVHSEVSKCMDNISTLLNNNPVFTFPGNPGDCLLVNDMTKTPKRENNKCGVLENKIWHPGEK